MIVGSFTFCSVSTPMPGKACSICYILASRWQRRGVGSPLQKQNGRKNSLSLCQEKHQILTDLPKHFENTGYFVGLSCKFPDSKDKGYCDICHEILKWIKVGFAYETVANF